MILFFIIIFINFNLRILQWVLQDKKTLKRPTNKKRNSFAQKVVSSGREAALTFSAVSYSWVSSR
jgi:hypothetical protein